MGYGVDPLPGRRSVKPENSPSATPDAPPVALPVSTDVELREVARCNGQGEASLKEVPTGGVPSFGVVQRKNFLCNSWRTGRCLPQ